MVSVRKNTEKFFLQFTARYSASGVRESPLLSKEGKLR